jgi:hypothetical protein
MEQRGAITPAEVDQWVDSAAPGASRVYAWGDAFPRMAPGVKAAQKAAAAGLVTFATRRNGSAGRCEYVMQRLAKRLREAAAKPAKGVERTFTVEQLVMNAFRRAAASQAPCPSNDALARLANLPDSYAASYIVRKLRDAGRIRVEFIGPRKLRRVTIVRSGKQTDVARA